MINFLKKYWLLIIILILAAFLRFYRLDSYPALNADEAAIGYNAYSLIQTGRDEHGNSWPIHFQSFNDYKPGLYFYLVIPFVKVLGLSSLAVRIPNALLGVLTVFAVYLLIRELFGKDKFALASALFLAVSPWHIHFSRGGWEVNTATFFITLGVLLFVRAVRRPNVLKRQRFGLFALCALNFALSLYTYHAARIVVPVLGAGMVLLFRKEIFTKSNARILIFSLILFAAVLIPLGRDIVGGGVLSRAAGVGLFADKGPISRINEQRGEHGNINSLPAILVHNKVVNYGLAFIQNWALHFSGEFLFMTGDVIQRNRVPETGEMYLTDIVFLIAGFIALSKMFKKEWGVILIWLITAPIAAALTFQAPHALRAENMVIPLVIISAFGFTNLIEWMKTRKRKILQYLLVFLTFALIAWNFARYEHMYWIHMAKAYPFSSQYGVWELADYINHNGDGYDHIIITDSYDQPYILMLFYLKYPPEKFQLHHNLTARDAYGFSTVREFDKYRFEPVDFESVRINYPRSLIIGTPKEIPDEANIVKKIFGANGYEYFDIVAN